MKILIIRLSSIGDIVLTQSIVKKLHDVFPDAELHYLTKEQYIALPKHFGIKLKVITYIKSLRFHLSLAKEKYDYVFDLHAKFSTFLIKLAAGREYNFTYSKRHFLRKAIVLHKTQDGINSTLELYQTALSQACRILDNNELLGNPENPVLSIEESAIEKMGKRIPKAPRKKIVALFPGATHVTKMYPADGFIKLIQKAGDEFFFWLLGSKSETSLTYKINFETADKSTDLCGKFDLEEIIAVIALSDIVITNDSGPMHIAAALQKPQIAIFGATHPRLGFKPNNPKARIICKELVCQPCTLHGEVHCPKQHFRCMLSINPEEIVSHLKTIARIID
jgi:heptosyltransferase II